MPKKNASRDIVSRDQWAAQIAALDDAQSAPRSRRAPLTVGRIVDAALQLVEAEGFNALTMRRVAAALQATPGALYAHVRDKAELDDLMIGELCSRVTVPVPDPAQWKAQAIDVCRQLRDQYLTYPGIPRAALEGTPHSLEALRIFEGLFAILLAGGMPPQSAAWAIDGAFQYVGAYSLVWLRRRPEEDADGRVVDRAEVIERFTMLPQDRFPNSVAYAREMTSGEGHDRFDFTLGRLLAGPDPQLEGHHEH
ncbi:TetR/AcrR family transcriptional regulator [Streptacidiphilus sp. EB129]|uniref:TetR/AcrR family transcriptional regulator n=1 Tax=Streptacidiphilus sp. EB129 TaxID=3156262 RepID=UPI0035155C25